MSVVRAQSLVDQVHTAVDAAINAGELAPGMDVGIAQLAKRYGVSHTPVREALARLAAEGRLLFSDNIGYRMPALPTAKDYTDWAVARVIVEANALLYVIGPLDERLLDEAQCVNDEIRATDFGKDSEGVRRFSTLNWRFHRCLIDLAHNPLLREIHERLNAAPQFSRIFLHRGILHQGRVVAEHQKILHELRRGERTAAAGALRDHIIDSLERDALMHDVSVSLRRLVAGRQQP